MIDNEFSIYVASKTRWVHLVKIVPFPAVPRVGEFVKFQNSVLGDYFAYDVSAVTYRKPGKIEVMTSLLDDDKGKGFSLEEELDFDECYESYLAEGWTSPHGVGPSTRLRANQADTE